MTDGQVPGDAGAVDELEAGRHWEVAADAGQWEGEGGGAKQGWERSAAHGRQRAANLGFLWPWQSPAQSTRTHGRQYTRVGSSVRSESGLSVAVVDSINMGDASSLGHVPHQPQLAPRFALHVEQLPIEQQGKS